MFGLKIAALLILFQIIFLEQNTIEIHILSRYYNEKQWHMKSVQKQHKISKLFYIIIFTIITIISLYSNIPTTKKPASQITKLIIIAHLFAPETK